MRIYRAPFQLGLFPLGWLSAGIMALLMFQPDYLMAQVIPTPSAQAGSVTGVVRTTSGAPAANVRVTAMRVDAADDKLRAMDSLTQTDATGRYRLENVPPGRYVITAGRVDLPTYYPGTLDITKGTIISVTSLSLGADIDFVIQDTSAAVPAVAGVPGLRGMGPGGNIPAIVTLNGNLLNLGSNFQAQGGAQRSGGGRIGGPGAPAPQPATGRGSFVVTPSQAGGAWWTNAALVARLGLTDDQKKKIETTFEQHRQTLVLNKAELEKEEAALGRMLGTEPLEPAKTVITQIERVVQARAEMERTNSKMTLEIRQNLTRSQWMQLQAEAPQPAIAPVIVQPAPRTGGRNTAPPVTP